MEEKLNMVKEHLYQNPILLGDMMFVLANKKNLYPKFLNEKNVIDFLDSWSFYLRVESAVVLIEEELNLASDNDLHNDFDNYKKAYIIITPLTGDILEKNISPEEGVKKARIIPKVFPIRLEKSIVWQVAKLIDLSGYNPIANVDKDIVKVLPIYEENPVILTSAIIERQRLTELQEAEKIYNKAIPYKLNEFFKSQLNLILARLYYYKSIIRTNEFLTFYPVDSMLSHNEFNLRYYLEYREEYIKASKSRIHINLDKFNSKLLNIKELSHLFKQSNDIIIPSIERELQITDYIIEMRQILDIFISDNKKNFKL